MLRTGIGWFARWGQKKGNSMSHPQQMHTLTFAHTLQHFLQPCANIAFGMAVSTSCVSGRGHRIRAVCLSFDLWPWFLVCVCVSVSIMAKGLSGKRTVHEENSGGKSTLRRFHYVYICVNSSWQKDVWAKGVYFTGNSGGYMNVTRFHCQWNW